MTIAYMEYGFSEKYKRLPWFCPLGITCLMPPEKLQQLIQAPNEERNAALKKQHLIIKISMS